MEQLDLRYRDLGDAIRAVADGGRNRGADLANDFARIKASLLRAKREADDRRDALLEQFGHPQGFRNDADVPDDLRLAIKAMDPITVGVHRVLSLREMREAKVKPRVEDHDVLAALLFYGIVVDDVVEGEGG